jgi:AcrR family transcriptional regulator
MSVEELQRKPRRSLQTQAERSATSQSRILEAAITCLHRYGFSAVTMAHVAEEAGLSRGAMQYHFASKTDLILKVAEHIVRAQDTYTRQQLREVPRGLERLVGMTRVSWAAMQRPPAVALMEVMVGARSDPLLAEKLPLLLQELEQTQLDSVWEVAEDAGLRDRAAVDTIVRLSLSALRGMTMEKYAFPTGRDFEAEVDWLMEARRQAFVALLESKASDQG